MGKPSVVSANGGLADAVVDAVTGYVVPKGDIERLVEVVERLLDNPELARRLGHAARARVENRFDIRKNTREMEQYFAEYASRGDVSAPVPGDALPEFPRAERQVTREVHR
jgi:glycosyltransferase involved in cell wall biosynthesis